MTGIRQAIQDNMPALSKAHRLLAGFIQSHPEQAAFMTSFQLAAVTGLSQATVMRLPAALGYAGYTALRQALRDELKYRLDALERFEVMSGLGDPADVIRGIAAADSSNIKKTLSANTPHAVGLLAQKLTQAKKVYIYGQHHAAPAALYLAGYLKTLLPNVECLNLGGIGPNTLMADIGEDDLYLSISFPLHTAATLALLEFAAGRDAFVATVSESAQSEAGRMAGLSLVSEWGDYGVNGSLAPVISLCSAIICLLAQGGADTRIKLARAAEAHKVDITGGENA